MKILIDTIKTVIGIMFILIGIVLFLGELDKFTVETFAVVKVISLICCYLGIRLLPSIIGDIVGDTIGKAEKEFIDAIVLAVFLVLMFIVAVNIML